ncbi:hypothetical protein T11_5870 [Trichinella zimbabwensis]|uniref:Uncharacterized protein n=1 Tax=Trichinella zimbabwensis TaxID=268475 RepID=A0A0V1H518_9BILA|nr:hypothetical protein T11_5870 [Trichinella zimbabwensis]
MQASSKSAGSVDCCLPIQVVGSGFAETCSQQHSTRFYSLFSDQIQHKAKLPYVVAFIIVDNIKQSRPVSVKECDVKLAASQLNSQRTTS